MKKWLRIPFLFTDDSKSLSSDAQWRTVIAQPFARTVAITGILFILFTWGTMTWQVLNDRTVALAAITRENDARVMAFAQFMRRALRMAEITAANMGVQHADRVLATPYDRGTPPQLVNLPTTLDDVIVGARIYDAQGRLRAISRESRTDDLQGNIWFHQLKDVEGPDNVMFSPVLDPFRKEIVIMVGFAIRDSNGDFRGMVGIDIAARHLSNFSAVYRAHADDIFGLVSDEGITLMRMQGEQMRWGLSFPNWSEVLNRKATVNHVLADGVRGSITRVHGLWSDGKRRVISIDHLENWPVSTVTAMGEDVALAPSMRRAGWFLSMATIITLTVGGLLVLFFRYMLNVQQAERRIGDIRDELGHSARVASLSEMAAGLAHELNQPLTAASNYLALAEISCGREDGQEKTGRHLAQVRTQITRAGEIIRRIRDFLAKGNAEMRPEPMNSTLIDAIELAHGGSGARAVRVSYLSRNRDVRVMIDRIQIQQVLVNLIKNAREAVEHLPVNRRVVRIRWVYAPDGMIKVEVEDDGPGFPDQVLEQFNLPFISTKGDGGLGIGLSICRRIIEVHGGTLKAVNREQGATVSFTIQSVARLAARMGDSAAATEQEPVS